MLPDIQQQLIEVSELLVAKGQKLVTAESCTGGAIAQSCTHFSGSSAWFECGFVTYSNKAKSRDLAVPQEILDSHGAVSQQTVEKMVSGAARFGDLAVATSGIAGPTGAVPGKPVGTVWIACGNQTAQLSKCYQFDGDRASVQEQAVLSAFQLLKEYLDK